MVQRTASQPGSYSGRGRNAEWCSVQVNSSVVKNGARAARTTAESMCSDVVMHTDCLTYSPVHSSITGNRSFSVAKQLCRAGVHSVAVAEMSKDSPGNKAPRLLMEAGPLGLCLQMALVSSALSFKALRADVSRSFVIIANWHHIFG